MSIRVALPCLALLTACGSSGDMSNQSGADGASSSPLPDLAADAGVGDDAGSGAPTQVAVDPNGDWRVSFAHPTWTFGGSLGTAVTGIVKTTGSDAIGAFEETTFDYADPMHKRGAIRVYVAVPVALFTQTYVDAAAVGTVFPTMSVYPQLPHHLSYGDHQFAPHTFTNLVADSPWLFFDDQSAAFLLSGASQFMNTSTTRAMNGAIASGIDPKVGMVPAGFAHSTILVAEPSINRAYDTWGQALTALSGKKRPANDATVELTYLGYWTDHFATYWYKFDQTKGYAGTLLAVRDALKQQGIPIGYMQLDSWWYPKGKNDIWSDYGGGEYTYDADKTLFPMGLGAFQRTLGLPLITHARWIDPMSPYRMQFAMSNNVTTDPAFWKQVATYLKSNGVITYEQDWLNQNALPRMDNLVDGDAFMDHMAAAMKNAGLSMQYCMPLPRHYLQSTRYDNLITSRVSDDGFVPARYPHFFYASRLASALGEWPWSDVFMSTQEGNLILSTLSAGMVGFGDPIGAASAANLLKAVRADGVIVKPDVPIVPLDATFVRDAQATGDPMVASTYSDHGGGLRGSYIFAYAAGTKTTASFSPVELGYTGPVWVYNVLAPAGHLVAADARFSEDVVNGISFYVAVPVGKSGIGFLGDVGKYASLGKKRIASWSDDGVVHVGVTFAAGETKVTLHGYSPSLPKVTGGAAGPVKWDAATQHFTFDITPNGPYESSAQINIAP
jgi:hypothetical protein